MKAIRVLWIDGQTEYGGSAPVKLELRRDREGLFRWYGQGYNEDGYPDGPCEQDSEVSDSTLAGAVAAAEMSWGGKVWNLRKKR